MSNQDSRETLVPTEIYSPEAESVFYSERPKHRYWVHALLFLATVFTTLVVGSRLEWNFLIGAPAFSTNDIFPLRWALRGHHLLLGIPFSLALMSILLAHEMGHYLYCLKYRVAATLPFFIPFPTLFGTFGAFIRIRSGMFSRTALFDIGIAGPIAGFALAFPILVISLAMSHAAPVGAEQPDIQFGYPLVFRLAREILIATGSAQSVANVPWTNLYMHPVAIAAWVGMFATSLNLLPGGQLDGGHIIYSISPRLHKIVSQTTILIMIPAAVYFWAGWLLWAVLLRISGARHPSVPEFPQVSRGRRWVAGAALIMLVLTIVPAPFAQGSLFEVIQQFRTGH